MKLNIFSWLLSLLFIVSLTNISCSKNTSFTSSDTHQDNENSTVNTQWSVDSVVSYIPVVGLCKSMSNYLTFTIIIDGISKKCTLRLLVNQFSHTIQVNVDEWKLFFEQDEEGNYRLIKMPWQQERDFAQTDKRMIEQIIQTLNTMNTL